MAANSYHPSKLIWRKNRWYVSVTKPRELQFGSDKQARRSTGTSDKRQAERLQYQLTNEIYEQFNKDLKQSDPVFEAVRHHLEAEGVNCRQWYDDGKISLNVSGERTAFERLTGAKVSGYNTVEQWVASNHVELLGIVSGLGHPIPSNVLMLISAEDREEVLRLTKPKELPTNALVEIAKKWPSGLAEAFIEGIRTKSVIELDDVAPTSVVTKPTLATVYDAVLESRKPDQRKNFKTQLKKWLDFRYADKPLADVDGYDAYEFLEHHSEDLAQSSIRVLNSAMSQVYVWANKKRDLQILGNPFISLDLRDLGKDATPRRPFTRDELKSLFKMQMTQDERTAFAILVTTGMRGGELMQVNRLEEEGGIRFFDLTAIKTKTRGSKRKVPVPSCLGSFTLPVKTNQYLLNRLLDEKWSEDPHISLHSLRHTFVDLARDSQLDTETREFIVGHRQGDMSGVYGVGPSLEVRQEFVDSIPHPWLVQ